MTTTARAIETTGTIDEQCQLQLDLPFPIDTPTRVRVIVLFPEENDAEFDEAEWLKAASTNPAFDFLNEKEEDIYALTDGKPLQFTGSHHG